MELRNLTAIVIVVLLLGFVLPTGAVPHGDDVYGEKADIVLKPHPGTNGQYASVGDNGNVSIDLSDPGVNLEARTGIDNIIQISNYGNDSNDVWITHNGSDAVQFYAGDGTSVEGVDNNISIAPDESISIGININTRSRDLHPGDFILQGIQIHTKITETTETPTPSKPTEPQVPPAGGGTSGTPGVPEPSTPSPPTTPGETTPDAEEEELGVEVELEDEPNVDDETDIDTGSGDGAGVQIREMSVEELDEQEGPDQPPRAVISSRQERQARTGGADQDRSREELLRSRNIQAVTEVNEELTLSGVQSLVGTSEAVDRQKRIVKAVDITVPENQRTRGGTVRMTVQESKFGDTDLSRARIGHLTDEGWQLLPTRVVSRSGGTVVLEAQTPSFSPFAAFADNEVRYTWEVDGEQIDRDEIEVAFDEPGIHNATLTVTDAFGRSSNATYRILANDRPEVEIETVGNATPGQPTTLHANVTNEVGNVTVEWLFADGTRTTGVNVTKTFDSGSHPVRVTVEDEYGATTQVERDLEVGVTVAESPFGGRVSWGLPSLGGLLAIFALSFALVVLLRWLYLTAPGQWVWRAVRPWLAVLRRRSPRIVEFDEPRVNVRRRRFEIGHLLVEDPDGDLETVEITIMDGRGNEVGRKTVDVRGQTRYEARPEVIPPRSRVYVREDEDYTVDVTVEDVRQKSAGRQSAVRYPSPDLA